MSAAAGLASARPARRQSGRIPPFGPSVGPPKSSVHPRARYTVSRLRLGVAFLTRRLVSISVSTIDNPDYTPILRVTALNSATRRKGKVVLMRPELRRPGFVRHPPPRYRPANSTLSGPLRGRLSFRGKAHLVNREVHIWMLRGIALILAVFASACGGDVVTPTTPTQPQTTTPTFDLSPFVGVWHVTWRLTKVYGETGCVAGTMKSQLGAPSAYSLTITYSTVTITNPSGDYACTFDNFKTDSSGFTTYGGKGIFTCDPWLLAFRCSDGTTHALFSTDQDIEARVSGTEISGTWDGGFHPLTGAADVQIWAEFKGSK